VQLTVTRCSEPTCLTLALRSGTVPLLVSLHPGVLETKILRVWTPASCHENLIKSLGLFAIGRVERHGQRPIIVLRDTFRGTLPVNRNAALLVLPHECITDLQNADTTHFTLASRNFASVTFRLTRPYLLVEALQHLVTSDEEINIGVQIIKHAAKFNANVSGTNDAQALRYRLQFENSVGTDAVLNACATRFSNLLAQLDNSQQGQIYIKRRVSPTV
jgi:hypothetical protein